MQAEKVCRQEYRKKRYKPRKQFTIEMLFRKSFIKALKEYVQHCSIAGVKEMCDPNIGWKQRLFWSSIFCAMFSTMCYFLQYTWFDTLTKPLIVTMESSTYPISQIDFPAIAICNTNRISKKSLKEYAKKVYPILAFRNESLTEVENFCLQSGRLLDYSYPESLRNHPFLDVIASNNYDTHRTIETMKELAPSCDEMLVSCMWAGQVVDCMSIFAVRRTVRGHCCAFNYILDYDSDGKPNRTAGEAKRQVIPGISHGLTVVLDPLLDDYAYPISNIKGFDVLLFDPTHFADPSGGRVTHRIAEPNQVEFFELNSIKQRASAEIRKYPLSSRKCFFHDEQKENFSNMYSYSACIVNCRIKTIQSLCKCTPYFLPTNSEGPICIFEDLRCLNKYKEKLLYHYPLNAMDTQGLEMELQDSLYCPDCMPDCELTKHFTKSFTTPITMDSVFVRRFANGHIDRINLTDKCILNIYQSTADGILDRVDVVAYWFEILSNIGGFGGILVGFSIFSAVEIVYFLFVRVMKLFYSNYIKYY